jgi:hypothetical protein
MYNYCQILSKPYRVSGTEQAVTRAGGKTRMADERLKALKSLKNDIEFAMMRGTMVCGTGSAARSMMGVKAFMTSNAYGANNYTLNSQTSLSEAGLNDLLQLVWDDGCEVDAVYLPMYLKRRISGWTTSNTKNINADDKRLVNAVDVYQADAAKNVKLFPHRYVRVAGTDTHYDIVGIQEDMWRMAWLRSPMVEELAKTGDADKEQYICEGTLECRHNDAGFFAKSVL